LENGIHPNAPVAVSLIGERSIIILCPEAAKWLHEFRIFSPKPDHRKRARGLAAIDVRLPGMKGPALAEALRQLRPDLREGLFPSPSGGGAPIVLTLPRPWCR
jgi:hypothetical protein